MLNLRQGVLFRAALALAAGCLAGAAHAAPGSDAPIRAERPEVKIGDRWVSACSLGSERSERVWVVTAVDASGVRGTENGLPLTLSADLNEVESPRHTDTDNRLLSFPLELGKQWSATDQYVNYNVRIIGSAHGSQSLVVTVVGYERVRVGAGEFDAFKLEYRSEWSVQEVPIRGSTKIAYWYAPAARAVVKYAKTVSYWPEERCELVAYQLQP